MLDFNSVKLDRSSSAQTMAIEEVSTKDIAIIGISAKLPQAGNIEEFWEILKNGVDCIRPIPQGRKEDISNYFACLGTGNEGLEWNEAAYLDTIDAFDYRYFGLSPKEASLLDPNQRLFLETAWEALEDAGYGGERLTGSRTGVFVGFNSDSEYRKMIAEMDPSSLAISLPGNVKPIVASRLSYLKDFKGPNMIVDTTCSSSLVAVHLACKALRSGECDLAIVGGTQIHLIPIRQGKIGVEASDGRAKTFDDSSDGTGTGEGVVAMVLKPLWRAEKDRDNIFAVIRGSAVNHDGSSIGLTAPNAEAQEDVIVRAWQDAGITPETISYLEAHGTGTKLGDPIEIDGIQRAFRRFTEKKQFCAVGSVKTNIGHLDSAAGIVALLKTVLLLKHRQLVPSLHFNKPNRRITFEDSSVYINDQLVDWETTGFPRKCGVSAFGLSGTNCHVVLEEYVLAERNLIVTGGEGIEVLTLSAKSGTALKSLIDKYRYSLSGNQASIEDICYTANSGRGHYGYRMAVIGKSLVEIKEKLDTIEKLTPSQGENGVFYAEPNHSITKKAGEKKTPEIHDLTNQALQAVKDFNESGKQDLNLLQTICRLYISGAEVDWNELYKMEQRRRVSLPTYAFDRLRCWVEPKAPLSRNNATYMLQRSKPLLDQCLVESADLKIYSTNFIVERHWVLNEHKINGESVLVGTAHLEMVTEACREYFPQGMHLKDVQFFTPLIVGKTEQIEVHLVLTFHKDFIEFYVASRQGADDSLQNINWVRHVEGKVFGATDKTYGKLDIGRLKQVYGNERIVPDIDHYNKLTSFEFGPRWNNIREMFVGDTELLSYLEMPATFQGEVGNYPLHPALLDNALTTIPLLNKALQNKPTGKTDSGFFLPFSYKSICILHPLPESFYSYVRLISNVQENSEIVKFQILFADMSGNVFVEIEDYTLKRTHPARLNLNEERELYHQIGWVSHSLQQTQSQQGEGSILVLRDKDEKVLTAKAIDKLKVAGMSVIEVCPGESFTSVIPGKQYTVGDTEEDYHRLFAELKAGNITQIIHMLSIRNNSSDFGLSGQGMDACWSVRSLFYLTRAMLRNIRINGRVEILLCAENVYRISGREGELHPDPAAMFGLGKVIEQEYPNIKCRAVDFDSHTTAEEIFQEIMGEDAYYQIAYRNGQRFVEELSNVTMDSLPESNIDIKAGGVYLITGGTGGIGLQVAKYLGEQNRVNLALVNRTPMPARELWDETIKNSEDDTLREKLEAIKGIEKNGSNVLIYSADVSREAELKAVFADLRMRFGRIDGIVHSAGVPGDGFIINKDENAFNRVLRAKIQGTRLLDKLTEEDNLDFMVLFSSNNSLVGIPGQGDYTAANAFLDAFADYRSAKGKRTVAINWPAWKETGMAVNYGVNTDGLMKALPTVLGINAFKQILHKDVSRVIVGQIRYDGSVKGITMSNIRLRLSAELEGKLKRQQVVKEGLAKSGVSMEQGAVGLTGKVGGVYTEFEQKIAAVWKEVLGYEEFNVNDSFFEMGGDSVLITKVHSLMAELLPGKVQIADLFAYPTISGLASFLAKEEQPPLKPEVDLENEIVSLIEEVEKGNITLDEANKLMGSLGKNN